MSFSFETVWNKRFKRTLIKRRAALLIVRFYSVSMRFATASRVHQLHPRSPS